MHLLLGSSQDPLLQAVQRQLAVRGRSARHVPEDALLGRTPLALRRGGRDDESYLDLDGARLPLADIRGVLLRLPLGWWPDPELGLQDQTFIYHETIATWFCLLSGLPCPVINRFGLGWWLSDVHYAWELRLRLATLLQGDAAAPRAPHPSPSRAARSVYLAGHRLLDAGGADLLTDDSALHPAIQRWQQETGIILCRLDLGDDGALAVDAVDPAPEFSEQDAPLVAALAQALVLRCAMILVLTSSADQVYPTLAPAFRDSGAEIAILDEDHPERYAVQPLALDGRPAFSVWGGECQGDRPVGAIFCRHAVARTLDPEHVRRLATLQADLNLLLLTARCPVINPPAHAYSNYSKPYQVGLLAAFGFDVPRSLVTNIPAEARRFWDECGGQVIYKGVSNVPTLAQLLTAERLERLDMLPACPTLFQEYVAGVDYRVHVVGEQAFVTRLVSADEDYRRAALVQGESISVEAATLPADVIQRCIAFTHSLGLVVGGIDFKETPAGRLVVLELNPYPQFTFYGRRSGQPITQAVVDYLVARQSDDDHLLA